MNKYIRAALCVPIGGFKMMWTKGFHFKSFSGPLFCLVSPHTEITLDHGAELRIGKGFKMRDGAKIRVRKNAICKMGKNVSLNSNNMIACHEMISIGDNVQFSPNVQVYDHDHDFRINGGIKERQYISSPIIIGNNVWIGANVVILRGTEIGDNCVVGAGSVLKGKFPSDSVIIQKRMTDVRRITNDSNITRG